MMVLWLWVPGSALSRGPGTTANSETHLAAALEHQDLARLVRGGDLQSQPLDDLPHLGDLRGVRLGELARADPERVLEADAHIAAHRGRHRGNRHLVTAGAGAGA